ncbi:TIGR02646 family protein [Vibrio vulnificus]|uniref:retron Ec78 anti-phage system effector HNH endonuclease PtuB n=1 Tax=Vibrio vulnificus TaxID=672 RepID=UPI0010235B5E|nr:retron Ec78 anti-phage system effector HNH endonuclease PtuB [Vibrio vulnificus]EGQ7953937.1 TIGR02646 family protein [Vibrio vulnificus]EGQ7988630.1 TIGR02646 family protein [Vibrio vulnificus]EGQ9235884.1 TIGR02646 family protein [Vibrio vulnificus]EGQ9783030.1 TIGR02646 family protein [Vibrio vulnificus]EGR7960603.1 TIGR02646 family protein [Vibrio vulnificus]
MRKLSRPMPEPVGLSGYNHNTQKWTINSPDSACRTAIWDKLNAMQNGFCVYCESVAIRGNGHVEHFFHKGQKPDGSTPYKHLTFQWTNLFGCCGVSSSDTCGHYKDREGENGPGQYDSNDIIKPDVDDPMLFFNYLDTGVIEVKTGLSPHDQKRAAETLRVLNLALLNGARKTQIDIFKQELKELEKLSHGLDNDTLLDEMNTIKAKVCSQEYQSAVLGALF